MVLLVLLDVNLLILSIIFLYSYHITVCSLVSVYSDVDSETHGVNGVSRDKFTDIKQHFATQLPYH